MRLPSISNYIPSIRLATPKEMTHKLTTIALPVIALATTAMMQQSEAIGMKECFDNCEKHKDAHSIMMILCYAACAIFSKGS